MILDMILDMIHSGFPFIANCYILMIIDFKIHYLVDFDAIKAHVQESTYHRDHQGCHLGHWIYMKFST